VAVLTLNRERAMADPILFFLLLSLTIGVTWLCRRRNSP
jgi:hypothetical protein